MGIRGVRRSLLKRALLALLPLTLGTMTGLALAGQAAAESYTLTADLPYTSPAAGPAENQLDLYLPLEEFRPTGKVPVVIWIHGGGWYQGDKESAVLDKAERFTRAGYLFVSVNYRLSPRVGDPDSLAPGRVMFPDQPRDVAEAVGWVSRNAGRYGGDGRKLVLMGHSAGGQIAALLATDRRFLERTGVGRSQILGVVSLDAVGLEVAPLTDPESRHRSEDAKPAYWNAFGTPEENETLDRWKRASPLEYAGPNDPPFFFVVPDDVPLRLREARTMSRRLGLDPGEAVWTVSKTHRQINHHFGVPAGRGQTIRSMRFVRRVTR